MPLSSTEKKKWEALVAYFLLKKKDLQLSVTIRRVTSDLESINAIKDSSAATKKLSSLFSYDNYDQKIASLKQELIEAQAEKATLTQNIQSAESKLRDDLKSIKMPQSLHTFPAYHDYLKTLRKTPSDANYDEYLLSIKDTLSSQSTVSEEEKSYVEGRQVWTDVIAKTNEKNEADSVQKNVPGQVIKRIKALGYKDAESLYKECLLFLQEQSRLTISFGRFNFNKELQSFQLLNLFDAYFTPI